MGFVIENRLSDEDKQKYGYNTWCIDRKRGVFMIPVFGREQQIGFELYDYRDGKCLLKAFARDKSTGNTKDGLLRWYEIYRLAVPDQAKTQEVEMRLLLLEAIDEYGHDLPINAVGTCTVRVTFPNHHYEGIERERIYKGIKQ